MSRVRENVIALYTIFRKEVGRIIRIWPQTMLPPIITITLYFVIFGNLIGPRIGEMQQVAYIDYIVPGLIMMSIITNAYTNVVSSFFGSKFQKSIEEMLVSPMPNFIMVAGFLSGGIFRGILVGFLVTIVALFFTHITAHHVGVIISMAVLTAVLFSLAGLINGVFARKFDDISLIPTFVLTPLTYLGGIFFSIDLLPGIWQKLALLNPIFYMVNAFRYGMLGITDVSLLQAYTVVIAATIFLYLYVMWLIGRGVGIRN